ncbi:MAG: glycoside hydrolase family 16 protein [Bacteroidales bacterium]|nr:glycoside hydrolase family 16 protein [Bacteroidales bacterium]
MLNFSIVYKTKGWANYVVSHRDGTCTNCIISDNSLTVIFQDHNLPVGQLSRELHIYNENELFQSGIQHVVFYSEPNIYLTERDSDPATVLSEEVLANILLLQPTTPQEPEVPGVINLDAVRSVMFTLNAQTQTLQRWLTIFHEAYNTNRLKHNSYDANILQLQTLVQNVVSISNFQSLSNAIVEQFETIRTEILKTQPPAHTHYRNTILSKTARVAIPAEHTTYELPDTDFADTFTCSIEVDTTLQLPDIPLGMSYELNVFNFSQSDITVTFTSQYAEQIFNSSVVLAASSMTHLIVKRFNYYLEWDGQSSDDYISMLFIVNYAAITDPALPQSVSLMSKLPDKPELPKQEPEPEPEPEPPCPYYFNPAEYQGSIDFANRKWITQQAWGICHPNKTNSYYSNDAVFVDDDGYMHLHVFDQHKKLTIWDSDKNKNVEVHPRFGIGLVTCCDVFTYGKFTFVAKLPRGPRLWPSIWLYDADTWPPELDLFEGYSNRFGGYFNILTSKFSNTISDSFKLAFKGINPSRTRSLLNWCLEPNLSNTDGHTKPYNNFSNWSVLDRLRRPDKDFVEYTLDWRKDKIRFIFDGLLIREITDPVLVSQFHDRKLRLIMNLEVTPEYTNKDYARLKREFIIKSFKYTHYENIKENLECN